MKTALLVIAHGSPRAESNEDITRIIDLLRTRGRFDFVDAAFLECNEPDIPGAIDDLVAWGARKITIVPYFLHTGKHVADDVPTLLEEAHQRHPGVEFLMSCFVGRSPRVTDILGYRADEALQHGSV